MNTLETELHEYMNNLPKRYSVAIEGDSENTNYGVSIIGTSKGANCYVSYGMIVADYWEWQHGDLVELRSVEYANVSKLKVSLSRVR